jgi:hypothetical protein
MLRTTCKRTSHFYIVTIFTFFLTYLYIMELSLVLNNTNITCQSPLLWDQSVIDSERPILYICIVATIFHSVFWLQLAFCPTVRQKTMQWLYAYLATDILLLIRFFFLFIVHTTSTACVHSIDHGIYSSVTSKQFLTII